MIEKPKTYEGRLMMLNGIKEGSSLEFSVVADGVVKDVLKKVTYGNTDNVAEARLWVLHSDGNESFHTYRHDGRSQHSSDYDITLAVNHR